jgi:hypothetical protein
MIPFFDSSVFAFGITSILFLEKSYYFRFERLISFAGCGVPFYSGYTVNIDVLAWFGGFGRFGVDHGNVESRNWDEVAD